MKKATSKLEQVRLQIVGNDFRKKLPFFYGYSVCKRNGESKSVTPFTYSKYHNSHYYSVHNLYKPIINNIPELNLNNNE